jgi:uncharacterized RDD family membrane protein YckC
MTADIQLAGFWRRFAALIIDLLLIAIILALTLLCAKGLTYLFSPTTGLYSFCIAAPLIPCAYFVGFLSSKWQATPGYRLIGAYVAQAQDYQPLSRARAFSRWLLAMGIYMLPVLFIIATKPGTNRAGGTFILWLILFLIVTSCVLAFSKKKRTLHDWICSTRVLCGQPGNPVYAKVETPSDTKFAGFWRRLLAHIVDGLILIVPFWLIMFLFYQENIIGAILHLSILNSAVMQVVYFIPPIVYYVFFLSSRWQATPGKRLMKVYIVCAEDHQPLSKKRALARLMVFEAPTLLITAVGIVLSIYAGHNTYLPGTLPQADQHQLAGIPEKIVRKEALTPEEEKLIRHTFTKLWLPKDTPEADIEKFEAIQDKKGQKQALTPEEVQFDHEMNQKAASKIMPWASVMDEMGAMVSLYTLVLALTVAWTREKKGIHDMICKTRALYGRTA